MSWKTIKETERIKARDLDGRHYTIVRYTEYVQGQSSSAPDDWVKERVSHELENGEEVVRISESEYKILRFGTLLKVV